VGIPEGDIAHDPFETGYCVGCHAGHEAADRSLLKEKASHVCLSCHRNLHPQFEETSVHEPFKSGACLTCHKSHSGEHSHLLAQSWADLCLSCHEDMAADQAGAGGPGPGHQPVAEGRCRSCHQAHASSHSHLLAEDEWTLCLSCHREVKAEMEKQVVHLPLGDGRCLVCHEGHQARGEPLLAEPEPGVCTPCHDPASSTLLASHFGIAFGESKCTGCHEAHASDGPGLFRPVRHRPFQTGRCDQCHP